MPLPNFIIIGAMKSGTTTLHHKLDMHPQIGMSRSKEPNFFNKFFSRGVRWYAGLFKPGFALYGEASPNYSKAQTYPNTAANMHSVVPDAKLIYIVRDPIKRIISHLHHNLYRDRLQPNRVDHEVLHNPEYIATSAYYYQASHFLRYYPRERCLFISFESLKKDSDAVLRQIYDFLEVEHFTARQKEKIYNDTAKKYLIKYHDWVHKWFPRFMIKVYHHLFFIIGIKRKRPRLQEATIKVIRERLHGDIEKFKKLTGMSFREWKTYHQDEHAMVASTQENY